MTTSHLPAAGLSTAGLRVRVAAVPHLLLDLDLLPHDDPLLKTEVARGCPIALALQDRRLAGTDFVVTSLHEAPDTVIATCMAEGIEARLSWMAGPHGALRMLVQLRILEGSSPRDGELALPILDHLHPGDLAQVPGHDPGQGPPGHDGRSLVRTGCYPLPHSWWSRESGVAVLARYARDTQEESCWRPVPASRSVWIRAEWMDACELVFVACEPGWLGALQALRGQLRAGVDLAEYDRADCRWYRRQWLQHFTFLYGGEIFDQVTQRFDLVRLLDDGRRFGGYDGLLLWPHYPRIGIDQRDQWAIYDDLPGGRMGMRALAEQARTRGTRVFIPYLPWDAPPAARHGGPPGAAHELARVVADIGADGVFLDTMDSILPQFRHEIDRRRSGVVFCSEGQPDLNAVGLITGSWDQAAHDHAGEVDLLRFLFPEHPSFMINRHAIGAHRERVIARALFNGTGLVVWQDIFGEVLPYTATEAARIRAAVGVLRRHAACFRGGDALPLVAVAHTDLLANAFIAVDGRALVTIYNAGDEVISGDLLAWSHDAPQRWTRVGDDQSLGEIHEMPRGTVAPGHVAIYAGVPGP
jgi:hypothetical protein